MPGANTTKVQPWKALSSLAESESPEDHARLARQTRSEPRPQGASVSKPMDRQTRANPTPEVE
jgi:hypothetical protein